MGAHIGQSRSTLLLRVKIFGKQYQATPLYVQGLLLICSVPSFTGQVAIHEFQVLDKADFWRAWKSLGGERQGIMTSDADDETGERAVPFQSPHDQPDTIQFRPKNLCGWRAIVWRFLVFVFPWLEQDRC